MEKFNFNPEVSQSEQELKSYSLKQVKKWLNASMLVGLSLIAVGCEGKTDSPAPARPVATESKDIFDKAADRVDKMIEEGEQARKIAEDHGLTVNDGDKVFYKKKYGQIVEVEVNGQKIELGNDSQVGPNFNIENKKQNENEVKPEIKTNPEAADYLN